jgi:hypothetical protein
MSKKSKIKRPKLTQSSNIKKPKVEFDNVPYDELCPAFSFEFAQDNYCLSEWRSKDIKKLISKFKIFESQTWKDIKLKNILHWHKVDKNGLAVAIPNTLTADIDIYYIKPFGQNTAHRIFGFKDRHNFKFLWFDKNHELYP